jgi:hypothetical protein
MSGAPQVFEIFRSAQLVARAVLGMSADRCVVTFSPFDDNRSLGRPGFEQGSFRKSRIDAIHVIPGGNQGYQYPELPQLCSQIAEVTATYEHVVAYGSSMGGYAAIRYGGWAGAHVALALSPQFTLDPSQRPYDGRWRKHVKEVRFLHEHGNNAVKQAIVVYDPSDDYDCAHAGLLHTITSVVAVPLPGSGHPSTSFLSELDLLHRIAIEVCYERFVPEPFLAEVSRRREESPQFHVVRALRARNLKERYRLITQAAARTPTHSGTLHALAEIAIEAGFPEVALDALDRTTRAEPGRTQYLRSLAHAKAGQLEQAIEIMEELCRPNTESPVYRSALSRLKRRRTLQAWVRQPWRWLARRSHAND